MAEFRYGIRPAEVGTWHNNMVYKGHALFIPEDAVAPRWYLTQSSDNTDGVTAKDDSLLLKEVQ